MLVQMKILILLLRKAILIFLKPYISRYVTSVSGMNGKENKAWDIRWSDYTMLSPCYNIATMHHIFNRTNACSHATEKNIDKLLFSDYQPLDLGKVFYRYTIIETI